MTEIIKLDKYLFPVGAIAYHPKYHGCTILKTEGLQRKIHYAVIGRHRISFKTTIVPIKDLRVDRPQESEVCLIKKTGKIKHHHVSVYCMCQKTIFLRNIIRVFCKFKKTTSPIGVYGGFLVKLRKK